MQYAYGMIGVDSIFLEWGLVLAMFAVAVTISVRQSKRDGVPEIAPASSRQKVVGVSLIVAMCGSWAIYYAGWQLFGGYEKQVALFAQFMMILYAARLLTLLRTA
ncbi:hypothetical protein L7H23_06180 [Sphingopyxis sp. BSN-002]|uniref:hypothetical protein n=1 Tax=Sphingopyxis sp. BSN-002 TaxID=2911495 RepID=UPI001EDA8201|nr:hypothetical protein [Sphingopyxis sp. BSN-002]UKK85691.1 hypothetical protein L7H23_06180 [Sphingopyxis sp. BSN-002]